MSTPTPEELDLERIRRKRIETLIGVWDILLQNKKFDSSRLRLSPPLVNEVIEQYLADYSVLKVRYKIQGTKIQLHKIAGLLTASILRFRPVIPLVNEYESDYEMCANEILAVIQGVAICGEYTAKDGHLALTQEAWFNEWFKDFIFLLHRRNYTAESVIFVYQTLCCLRFPENLTKGAD